MQLDVGHDPRLDPTLQGKNTKDVTKSTDREYGQVVDWYHRFAEVDHCTVVVYERVLFLTRCLLTCLSEVKQLSRVRLFATPWPVAYQAPPSMGFSRQEYWSGLPFPSPGDLPDPGIEPGSPALWADALLSKPPGNQPSYHLVANYLNFFPLGDNQRLISRSKICCL